MTKTTTETGEVAQVDHTATSKNGNPTYRVRLTDGRSFLTETDGGVGYAATNYRPRGGEPSPVILTMRGSRIIRMQRPDGSDA